MSAEKSNPNSILAIFGLIVFMFLLIPFWILAIPYLILLYVWEKISFWFNTNYPE